MNTNKNPNRRLLGMQSYLKGKSGENYFENCCRAERLCYFRISDGAKIIKNHPQGGFRYKQVCDFVVVIGGNFWLLDTKLKGKTPTYSFFFPPKGVSDRGKMNSTQRQAQDFIKAFNHGCHRSGFIIKNQDFEYGFKFLSAGTLAHASSNADIVFREIGRISELGAA